MITQMIVVKAFISFWLAFLLGVGQAITRVFELKIVLSANKKILVLISTMCILLTLLDKMFFYAFGALYIRVYLLS